MRPVATGRRLFQVSANDLDQFVGRLFLSGRRFALGAEDVKPDMAFEHLGHERVDGAARGGERHEDARAVLLVDERLLDGIDLPANPADSLQQLRLIVNGVSHVTYTIPP